jgi:hypothetical protein
MASEDSMDRRIIRPDGYHFWPGAADLTMLGDSGDTPVKLTTSGAEPRPLLSPSTFVALMSMITSWCGRGESTITTGLGPTAKLRDASRQDSRPQDL